MKRTKEETSYEYLSKEFKCDTKFFKIKNSNSVQVKIDYKLKTLELFMSSN